jgi:hypothetical protein
MGKACLRMWTGINAVGANMIATDIVEVILG